MKFYNNEFATELVAEFVRSNEFKEVAMEAELTKGIEAAKAEKDDFFDEVKKASKKARNDRSFTKLERVQMKQKAAKKRAKALGVEGSPEDGEAFYNAVAKTNHYATGKGCGRLYNAECREAKRKDAEKRLMRQTEYEPDYDYFDARKALAAERLYDAGFTKVQLEEEITNKVKEQAKAEEMLHRLQDYMQMLKLHCHNLEEESDILQMRLDDATETYNAARYDYDAISLWG